MNNILYYLDKKYKCCGCGSCVSACPNNCINLRCDDEGFLYPQINHDICIDCKKCILSCPIINHKGKAVHSLVYACQSKDDIRKGSSSGGVFFELAKIIIEKGGIVFGAKFDKNWDVIHDYTTNLEGIKEFQKSKYVQSIIVDCLPKVKYFLDKGLTVLFSGTPCQIAGLKQFLKNNYDNLITVDIVCHGVPSPYVWHKYLDEVRRDSPHYGYHLSDIDFRDKEKSWKNYNISLVFKTDNSHKVYSENVYNNPYMRLFLDNIILRPSCHQCYFRNQTSGSDITIGDFWGIENIIHRLSDDKGTSLVLINTTKGLEIFKQIDLKERVSVDYNLIVNNNPALIKSFKANVYRPTFFILLKFLPISKIFKHYMGKSTIGERVIYRLICFLFNKCFCY